MQVASMAFLMTLLGVFSSPLFAQDAASSIKNDATTQMKPKMDKTHKMERFGAMADPTPEQRKVMADSHEKMAQCLRSDKPFKDCREEMHQQCTASGANDCGMMGYSPKGAGFHRGMMAPDKSDKAAGKAKK